MTATSETTMEETSRNANQIFNLYLWKAKPHYYTILYIDIFIFISGCLVIRTKTLSKLKVTGCV